MKAHLALAIVLLVGILALPVVSVAQTPTPPGLATNVAQKEAPVTTHATGTFDVKIAPQDDKSDDKTIARMTIDKQFHGDLEGSSKGQMLAAGSGGKGSSGAYVALEKVSGTLAGRTGTFVLQHTGIMTKGAPHLSVTVVPDSGTGQLAGLSGSMIIKITDGKHFYEFDYTLAEAH